MGRVRALQTRLAGRRDSAQIAGDIGRRQPKPAQARNHQMGKVLANAAALLEDFPQRRRDHGCLWIILELASDPVHQIDRAGKDAAARRKARGSIGGDRGKHRHQRARKDIADRRRRPQARGLKGHVAHRFPRPAWRRAVERIAGDLDARSRVDTQMAMRRFDQDALGMGPEEIITRGAGRGPGPDLDGVRDQLLSIGALRLQPQRAARETHRTFVAIGGDVADVVDHARPVSFSGRLALGPCGK